METYTINVTVNGRSYTRDVESRLLLVDFLRDELRLKAIQSGCDHGSCGACDVIVDGMVVRGCLMFAIQADGCDILTLEGLMDGDNLHPIQQAFVEHHGVQCGFCTSGMILTAYDFLKRSPKPSEPEIREAIRGNICRCTGYQDIVESIKAAAKKL